MMTIATGHGSRTEVVAMVDPVDAVEAVDLIMIAVKKSAISTHLESECRLQSGQGEASSCVLTFVCPC